MVEAASTVDLFDAPQEEYTRDLLAAVPRIGTGASRPEPTAREVLVRYHDVSVNFSIRQGLLVE